jgi:hypothetical protein
MPSLQQYGTLLEIGQGMLRVQKVQIPPRFARQHINAFVEVTVSLPVCGISSFDFHVKTVM